VGAEIARSLAVAAHSRVERRVGDVRLVVAVCDGHPSEVADAWGKTETNTVFALYDAKSLAVSLRRSPDCTVDLSRVASQLGGGGHAAAAGCELPDVRAALAAVVADRIEGRLA
jgi:nanoRNase/pAp phosphatase (c-di-AMP/oligoRNAs hydrolase)